MNVEFVRSSVVGRLRYKPGQVENFPASVAHELINNNLAKPADDRANIAMLRMAIGARPYDHHVYLRSRETLQTCQPGQKILIIRKYGGLGDILIASYVLEEIHRRFPGNPLTFATPQKFHELFQEVPWMTLVDYEQVHQSCRYVRGGVIQSNFADRYDVVEDISTPCHIWESIFKAHNFTREGLRWRNRVDMWLGHCGITGVSEPETCIKIHRHEIQAARRLFLARVPAGKPVVLVAPTSALDSKDFPFHGQLCSRLEAEGWHPLLIGDPKKAPGSLMTKTYRQLLGLIGAAQLVVSVDSAAFHGAGVVGVPCVGMFNINDGETYCKYYPMAVPVQLCPRPCIMRDCHECQAPTGRRRGGTCYQRDAVDQVMDAVASHPALRRAS